MSKRAEELAERILDTNFSARGTMSRKAVETIALIDAELRKERERCADRFRVFHAQMAPGSECSVEEICAAILKEEP